VKEPDRIARNKSRLAELHPAFRVKVENVIALLEAQGFRPRIQDAWRSPADQMKAFKSGRSKVSWGFHNATSPAGKKEALAVDMLDDDNPLASSHRYLLALAHAAAKVGGLRTGILWGVPAGLKPATEKAYLSGTFDAKVKIGWDPTHLEPTGLSVAAARAGKRPALVA
jgi:hypothetical protein